MKIQTFHVLCLLPAVFCSGEYGIGYELKQDEPLQATLDQLNRLKLVKAIGSIGQNTFSYLSRMEILEILDSTIAHITDGTLCTPPQLKELHIYTNRDFPPIDRQLFENCSKLEMLTVTNIWTSPDIFWDLTNLRYLRILDSKFQYFTKDYLKPLPRLEDFVLEDCEIYKIDSNALCVPPSQKSLEMINVDVPEEINKDLFQTCDSIQSLYISYSNGGYMPITEDGLSYFTSLKRLTLGHVLMRNLTRKFFPRDSYLPSSHLVNINLDSNKIQTIDDDAFRGLGDVEELSLSYNDIESLDHRIFVAMESLKILRLRMVNLHTIEDIGFLPNLRELYLGYNHIDSMSVSEVRDRFPKLVLLEIRGNPVDNNDTRTAFRRMRAIDPNFHIRLTDE